MRTRHRILALAVVSSLAALLPWGSPTGSLEAQGATQIQVDAAANRRAIDPRVYGVAFATPAQLAALNVPMNRWGGNATTRHNWRTNGDNRGSDWYFESIPGTGAPGAAFDNFVTDTRANGAEPMVTIPLIGWVGKNGPGGSKLASFSAAKYGAQQDCDWQWFPDACNGVRTNGALVTGNDPNDANVPVNAQYMREWAEHLVARWGTADNGGVRYYLYDNEPSIWHATHRDVHPEGQRMAELRDLWIAYGTAIRQVDPGAVLAGPEEWGWSGYFYSGYDLKWGQEHGCWDCTPERNANGDNVPWLLAQMRQHEQATGNRLLNMLTLHYYPQGGEFGSDTSSAMQARRNRSTRSLWDPSYVDETWIADRVRLVPRMKEWVNAHYPGLEIGITEYNWGAEAHINGATTQADILGIFGREGLDLGTFWTTPGTSTPTFKAFQMYRNYDGARSTFGDVSVRATGPNPDSLSVFAAERTSDGALTVMAINKVASSALVNVSLANFTAGATAQVWRLSSSNAIQRQADVGVTAGTINTTLPPQSITLFVVPRTAIQTPSLSIGDASVAEGNSGTTTLSFNVTMSAASASTVTVNYSTADATAVAPGDYGALTGNLTFSPGQTSRSIAVSVVGDAAVEPTETFRVNLSAPAGATIADGQGVGTIANDDATGPQQVVWTSLVGATSSGNSLTKTAAIAWGNAGAVSSQQIAGDGYVEVTGTANSSYRMFGLSNGNSGNHYQDIDFALCLCGSEVRVYEAGILKGSFGAFATGNLLRVAVVGTTVTYSRNGVVFYTSTATPTHPLLVDAALYSTGATLNNAVIGNGPPPPPPAPIVWISPVGLTVSGNSLTKTAALGWGNSGAFSSQQITGDGYVEVTGTANSTYRMFGLSNGSSSDHYQDIDFALCECGSQIRVYEGGALKGTFGNFATGNRLRVAVVGSTVTYSRNGVAFYTSTLAPTRPLLVDAALYNTGATLNAAVISMSP